MKSRNERFLNLLASNNKGDISIDLKLKKIFVNAEEFYDVINFSGSPIANLPVVTANPNDQICAVNWMKKNLDVRTYGNGDSIPEVKDLRNGLSLKRVPGAGIIMTLLSMLLPMAGYIIGML